MWIGTKNGLNRYDGDEIKVFKQNPSDPDELGSDYISSLYVDRDNHLWVGTEKGVYIYYPEYETFKRFSTSSSSGRTISGDVVCIKEDHKGNIWLAEIRGALFCYDFGSGTLESFSYSELSDTPLTVRSIEIDAHGTVWIGDFGQGLFKLSGDGKNLIPCKAQGSDEELDYVNSIIRWKGNSFIIGYWGGGAKLLDLDLMTSENLFSVDEDGNPVFCRVMSLTKDGMLLLGGESGLFVYDVENRRMRYHVQGSIQDRYALSDKAVHALYADSDGGVWVGTYFGGVDYCNKLNSPFKKYYPDGTYGSMRGRRIRGFCADDNGMIWVGTEDAGLNVYDPFENSFEYFEPSRNFTNIHGLCFSKGELWVGTYTDGVIVVDPGTRKIKRRYSEGNLGGSIRDNSVFVVSKGHDGDIYIGTYLGLQKYDPISDVFVKETSVPAIFVSSILEDSKRNLWVGTSQGVYIRMHSDGSWHHFMNDPSDESSLGYNRIKSFYEDSSGTIWIMTNGGGFSKFFPETMSFETYDQSDGLPNDVVFQMEEDDNGKLWISTGNGLACFDKDTREFRVFYVNDGLISNQFNDLSSIKIADGRMFFGGVDGFVIFNPSEILSVDYSQRAVLLDLHIRGERVRIGAPDSPLDRSLSLMDKLILKHSQNSFSFKISTFDYTKQSGKNLLCRLEGSEDSWQSLGKDRTIRFVELRHGHYRFVVKSVSDGNSERELASLGITIRPPWYASALALVAYIIIAVGGIYLILYYSRRRSRREYLDKLRKIETQSEKDLYESKIQFFTNIAHEIRTPLTLITGPLENMIGKKGYDEETVEDLQLMKKSSSKLLTLVNRLLDIRKIEHSGYSLNYKTVELTSMLKDIASRFVYAFRERGIAFDLNLPNHEVFADVDPEGLSTIVTNLLSNGSKYADHSLSLSLDITEDQMLITTKNDGPIIPADMREDIFKPFVRYSVSREKVIPGTGIGLVHSRALAELHGGALSMIDDDSLNVFRLVLPLHKASQIASDSGVEESDTEGEAGREGSGILIVEDQKELRDFEKRGLSGMYRVFTAKDGKEALEILEKEKISIIVSDVMMPVMDGFELCKIAKSDIRFSHIPIILLTAKTDVDSKVEGLGLGADSYVEKPFSMEVLKASISSLLLNRENIRKAFALSPSIPVSSLASNNTDKKFIDDIYGVISQNYSNTEFRMDDIASQLNMSRTTFYRKIQGVLDMTPNDLLRIERLKHAATLLKSGQYRIGEVCYMTGFNSPSYFSKCFQKQFGMTPTEYASEDSR